MSFLGDLPSSNGVLTTFNKRKMKRPFKAYVSTAMPTAPQVQITSFNCPMHLLVRTLQMKKATEGERKAAQIQMKKQIEKQMAALQNNLVVQQGQVRRQGITVSVQPAAHVSAEGHSQQQFETSAHAPVNSRPTVITESVPSTPVLIPSTAANSNVRIGSNRNPSPTSMTLNLLRKRRPLLRPLAVPATPNDSNLAAASAAASSHSIAPRAGIQSRSHPIVTYHVSSSSSSNHHAQQRAKRNRERGASDEAEQDAPATSAEIIEEDGTLQSPRAAKRPKLSSPTHLHASTSADRVRSPPSHHRVPVYHVRSAPAPTPPAAAASSSNLHQLPPRAPSPAHSIGSQSQSSQPSRAPSTSSAYRSLAASLSQTAAKSSNPAASGGVASHSASRANFALAMPSVPMTPIIPLTPSLHNSTTLPRLAYQTPGSILAANLAASAREQFQLMHPNLALRAQQQQQQQQQASFSHAHQVPHVSIEDGAPSTSVSAGGGSRYSRGLLRMQEARKEEQRRRDAAAAIAIQEAKREMQRQEERKQERGGVSSAEEEEEPDTRRATSSKPAANSTTTGTGEQNDSMFTPPRAFVDPPTPREPISLPSKRKTRQAVIESAAAAAAAAAANETEIQIDADQNGVESEDFAETAPRSNKRSKRTR